MNSQTSALVPYVCQAVASPETRRHYAAGLNKFLAWTEEREQLTFSRDVVRAYLDALSAAGATPATMNQHLTAIKLLAKEGRERGHLSHALTESILSIPGVKQRGVRMGHWLSREQAQQLVDAPDPETMQGKRDRALLALLLGCGLRRSEAATAKHDQIQMRDKRWLIVNLVGKGRKVRTIPMPEWAHERVVEWMDAAGITEGPVLRPVNRHGNSNGCGLTDNGVWKVVRRYADKLGFEMAPHDLRRSFSGLALKGGAEMRDIQAALGHSSIQTTERYLNTELNLETPCCDFLGVK